MIEGVSIFRPVRSKLAPPVEDEVFHLRRFVTEKKGPAVLCLHGAIENGRVFYSAKPPYKGFAPFLAAQGFDVFVADFRGHGMSRPALSADSRYGQHEMIMEDIPQLMDAVVEARGGGIEKIFMVAHSWGGVLVLSSLARFPELAKRCAGIVYFASKRSIRVWNLDRILKVSLIWNFWAPRLVRRFGYLPAAKRGWGADNETRAYFEQTVGWVKGAPWVDQVDAFDYSKSLQSMTLPKQLYLVGRKDRSLGHLDDVNRMIAETGKHDFDLWMVDYGHIDILTHPNAGQDHFPKVSAWIKTVAEAIRL